MQEGERSQGSFMANLLGPQDGGSLMPADSAFRMISTVPGSTQQQQQQPSGSPTASHESGGASILEFILCMSCRVIKG